MSASNTAVAGVPAGVLMDFAGASAPSGYLLCDGSTVSRVTYARLFEAIGTAWGSGDGSTTFKLPDFRGRVAVGSGQGTSLSNRVLAGQGGAETHTLTVSEMPSHTHTQNAHSHSQDSHTHGVYGSNENGAIGSPSFSNIGTPGALSVIARNVINSSFAGHYATNGSSIQWLSSASPGISSTTATNQNTGEGQAHNNMQPYNVVTKIIKF